MLHKSYNKRAVIILISSDSSFIRSITKYKNTKNLFRQQCNDIKIEIY